MFEGGYEGNVICDFVNPWRPGSPKKEVFGCSRLPSAMRSGTTKVYVTWGDFLELFESGVTNADGDSKTHSLKKGL